MAKDFQSKVFRWNENKSKILKENRGISFEDIILKIRNGEILDILEHPNKLKYPNQRIFVIEFNNYAYLVPFVEDEKEVFLKTIIPNRKATKKYLRRNENET